MEIQQLVLGELDTNTYLLIDTSSRECLIIDPADEASLIADEILTQNLKPLGIVATHGHYDHNLAAAELQLNLDLPYWIHQKDEFLIRELAKRASFWLKHEIVTTSPKVTHYLEDQKEFVIGKVKMSVFHTPGHTPGSCCLVIPQDQVVLTGDTLFANSIQGRTDLSYSSQPQIEKSLSMIKKNWLGYRGLPGHGNEFLV
ncbi:MAG TPA: MBL fold metallo-hydrolase [Candidatus Woesebacteria bacterium]|mgnify:CR=1 FL=1|nr:MBL fold metallo-hydrolase [Candidatus Woesebacteria bacterium]